MNDSYEGFRRLLIWQKAQELAVLVTKEIAKLPRNRNVDAMATQCVTSAGSVSANVAEGYGRYYEAAYRNHLSIARGSLFETESWIDLMFKSGFLSEEINQSIVAHCHEVGRLLTARMKDLDATRRSQFKEEGATWDVRDGSSC